MPVREEEVLDDCWSSFVCDYLWCFCVCVCVCVCVERERVRNGQVNSGSVVMVMLQREPYC